MLRESKLSLDFQQEPTNTKKNLNNRKHAQMLIWAI